MIGRIIGLDVGDRRIGVSVSDPLGFTAQGLETYTRPDDDLQADIAHLVAVFKQYAPYRIVLGLPRNMNGTYGPQVDKIRAFADELKSAYPVCEYDFYDERLTTASAQRMLIEADVSRKKRKQVVDKIAAVIILQDYLDSGAPARPVQ